jgi:tRNA (guanine-N7-)-methyltransferase
MAAMSLSASRNKDPAPGAIGLDREDLPAIGESPTESRFDPRTLWPAERRDRPLELEIGSGKGTFLVQQARQQPEINYLGIEYARAYWLHAADRCRRHGLENVRMLYYDAGPFVRWFAADGVFRQVHIYFPDPWPKKKHHKRRLITAAFLTELHRTLEPGGMVRIVTDHDGYWEWIEERIERVSDRFDRLAFETPAGAGEGEAVGTNFERKYRREGRPFNATTLQKR